MVNSGERFDFYQKAPRRTMTRNRVLNKYKKVHLNGESSSYKSRPFLSGDYNEIIDSTLMAFVISVVLFIGLLMIGLSIYTYLNNHEILILCTFIIVTPAVVCIILAIIIEKEKQSLSRRKSEITTFTKRKKVISSKRSSCHVCGLIVDAEKDQCPDCGVERIKCQICMHYLNYDDDIAYCFFCERDFHFSHLMEFVKMRGMCPVCKERLLSSEVVRKYDHKAPRRTISSNRILNKSFDHKAPRRTMSSNRILNKYSKLHLNDQSSYYKARPYHPRNYKKYFDKKALTEEFKEFFDEKARRTKEEEEDIEKGIIGLMISGTLFFVLFIFGSFILPLSMFLESSYY